MWATTKEYDETILSGSRRWATKFEILYGSDVIMASDVVIDGYVGLDNIAVRRELHVSFVDADGLLTPASARDMLAPKGTELRVWRGLYIPMRDDYEWVPLGVFGIVKPEVRSNSDGTILSIKGFDRVDAVRVRRFVDPWVVPKGTLVTEAISNIVTSRINAPVKISPSQFTTP